MLAELLAELVALREKSWGTLTGVWVPHDVLADMLVKHLDGILNYCRTKVRFGVGEALNGNIRMLINRGRGYKNVRYVLLKAKRMAITNLQFVELQQVRKAA
ncbi:MAG TPA: transposase [Bryobacteraceae bacterium]|nr:transposase [Bryobacteraceae bacterium]